jgi:two-component system response regulator HydG
VTRSILVIDDDPGILRVLTAQFRTRGWRVFQSADGMSGLATYEQEQPNVVLLDYDMPQVSGLEVLRLILGRDPDAAVIMLTGAGDIQLSVEAMRMGAENFLTKPVEMIQLELAAQRANEKRVLKRNARYIQRDGVTESSLESLGQSPAMLDVGRQLARLAVGDAPVLLTGETGTGKGWAAKLVHSLSRRADRPFVSINCAGLTPTFLDTELFGHERGAFTDAKSAKRGLFEVADGGSIFLDEIGDLAMELQPKLLTVLETNRFRRLGATTETQVNVRLIAATHRDLPLMVRAGRFREDLYYRLSVLPVHIPPLRERGARDVAELALRLVGDLRRRVPTGPATISTEALDILARCAWPGNVRELRNVLERAMLVAGDTPELKPHHLPRELHPASAAWDDAGPDSLSEVTRRHVTRVLERNRGNRQRTAKALGVTRATLYKWLKDWGMEAVGR